MSALRPALSKLKSRGLLLFASVPFALLLNSSQVNMTLDVEPDGGARRQIRVTGTPYFSQEFPRWVDDVRAGGRWDGQWRSTGANDYVYSRDYRTPNANYAEGRLAIIDVFQNPLSLYTTYTWTEDVGFSYAYATDAEVATAAKKQLQYAVRMPGRVLEASVTPSQGSTATTEGSVAEFSLGAGQSAAKITVTSAKLRWGYLLIVLYVLAWLALEVLQVVGRQLRRRPRKI